jgi:dihydrolipoamide dehydrogenase
MSGAGAVTVTTKDGKKEAHATKAILACPGSVPAIPPIPGAKDNPAVVDSTGLLAIPTVPKKLVVIGGGVIGIEFASLFSMLGSEVTIVEMLDEIVPNMDKELAPMYRKALSGITFKLGCKVEALRATPTGGCAVSYTTKEGSAESANGDVVLMAVGRRPVLQGWGAEAVGIGMERRGVTVDSHMRTNIPGVWAAGDVTGLLQLAHAATRQGEVAVADILLYLEGKPAPQSNIYRGNAVPWAVYGNPEAAGVGMTEQQCVANSQTFVKALLPMAYSGRFVAENGFAAPGTVKVIADAASKIILGVHAIGPYASEFIWGAAALLEQEFRAEEVRQLVFPHPSVSELIRDAAWSL